LVIVSRSWKSWHHSGVATDTNSALVLVDVHVVVFVSLILTTTGAESAIASSTAVLVTGAAITVARTTVAEA